MSLPFDCILPIKEECQPQSVKQIVQILLDSRRMIRQFGLIDRSHHVLIRINDQQKYLGHILKIKFSKNDILDTSSLKEIDSHRQNQEDQQKYVPQIGNLSQKMKQLLCYVHLLEFNKKFDFWIPHKFVESTKILIEDDAEQFQFVDHIHNAEEEEVALARLQNIYHENQTKIKSIFTIQIGKYLIDTFYYSPYPAHYHNIDILYVCHLCFGYFQSANCLRHHHQLTILQHQLYPLGLCVYKDEEEQLVIFEVDGAKHQQLCLNLSLLAKLFLDHKKSEETNYYKFIFYLLWKYNSDQEYQLIGYFSKPKKHKYINLSCILVMPQYQRAGFGKLLISFSYELSKLQQKMGSPERPLSLLGQKAYFSYWAEIIIDYFLDSKDDGEGEMEQQCEEEDGEEELTLLKMSLQTFISVEDIQWMLNKLQLISINEQSGDITLCDDTQLLQQILSSIQTNYIHIKEECIHYQQARYQHSEVQANLYKGKTYQRKFYNHFRYLNNVSHLFIDQSQQEDVSVDDSDNSSAESFRQGDHQCKQQVQRIEQDKRYTQQRQKDYIISDDEQYITQTQSQPSDTTSSEQSYLQRDHLQQMLQLLDQHHIIPNIDIQLSSQSNSSSYSSSNQSQHLQKVEEQIVKDFQSQFQQLEGLNKEAKEQEEQEEQEEEEEEEEEERLYSNEDGEDDQLSQQKMLQKYKIRVMKGQDLLQQKSERQQCSQQIYQQSSDQSAYGVNITKDNQTASQAKGKRTSLEEQK